MSTQQSSGVSLMPEKRVRADATAVIFMGAFAAAATLGLAILKFREVFVPGGISWNLPVQAQTATAAGLTLYSNDGPLAPTEVVGTLSTLQVVVPDVNSVSTICIGLSIVVAALAMLVAIACTMQLAWNFLRADFFTRRTSLALRTLTWTGVIGGMLAFATWKLGANGVEAAVGARAGDTGGLVWWSWYAIILFALCAFGLVDVGFRRAVRLQRDQEGLV